MSVKLTLLGTGTPAPLHHRAGASFLVTLGEGALLFDCGPGCVRRLIEKGVNPTRVEGLFLTHLHYDHCVDYAYLNLVRWDQGSGRIPELAVWGPPPLARVTERLLGTDGAFGPDLAARTGHPGSHFIYEMRGGQMPRQRPEPVVTEVADGEVIDGEGWQVRVAQVAHCQPQLTCLGYRLDVAGFSIAFSGDAAPGERLTELARGADALVHMCHFINGVVTDERLTSCCSGHLDAARTARAAEVDTLVMVHTTEQLEKPGVREKVLYEAGSVFGGRIVFGEDLLEVPLGDVGIERIR